MDPYTWELQPGILHVLLSTDLRQTSALSSALDNTLAFALACVRLCVDVDTLTLMGSSSTLTSGSKLPPDFHNFECSEHNCRHNSGTNLTDKQPLMRQVTVDQCATLTVLADILPPIVSVAVVSSDFKCFQCVWQRPRVYCLPVPD